MALLIADAACSLENTRFGAFRFGVTDMRIGFNVTVVFLNLCFQLTLPRRS